jgi:hypothetical protein
MDNRRRVVTRSRASSGPAAPRTRTVNRGRRPSKGVPSKKNLLNFVALVLCCGLALAYFFSLVLPKGEKKNESKDPNEQTIQTAKTLDELGKLSYPEISLAGFSTVPGFMPKYVQDPETKEYSVLSLDTSNTNLKIDAVGYYNGPFFENGSDIVVEKAFAIVVTNSSSSIIDNGKLILKAGDRQINFTINYLPARSTAVIVNDENTTFQKDADVTFISYSGTTTTSQDVKGKIEVTEDTETISLKNLTENELRDVNIYYKNKVKGIYYGGISYRSYLTKLDAGAQSNLLAQHYVKDLSEIVYYSFTEPVESSILDGSTTDQQSSTTD